MNLEIILQSDLPETLKNQLTVKFNSNLKINKTNEDKKRNGTQNQETTNRFLYKK